MTTSTKVLLSGLFLSPIVLTTAWVVLGFLNTGYNLWDIRIDSYSVIAQPISGLGLGNTAIYMNAAFIVAGILLVLGSIGFSRVLTGKPAKYKTKTAVLLSLTGIGTIISGIFDLESQLHNFGGLLALSPIVTFPYLGHKFRKDPKWRAVGNIMISASPVLLVSAAVYFASFNPERAGMNEGYAGLTERIWILILFAYYTTLGIFAVGSKDWK